jgi:hypothetical protein
MLWRHGGPLVLFGVGACAPTLPAKTFFIAARETMPNELMVGTFEMAYVADFGRFRITACWLIGHHKVLYGVSRSP